ncbi:hypothetical protein D3C78_1698790 [compost metagenome]
MAEYRNEYSLTALCDSRRRAQLTASTHARGDEKQQQPQAQRQLPDGSCQAKDEVSVSVDCPRDLAQAVEGNGQKQPENPKLHAYPEAVGAEADQ